MENVQDPVVQVDPEKANHAKTKKEKAIVRNKRKSVRRARQSKRIAKRRARNARNEQCYD